LTHRQSIPTGLALSQAGNVDIVLSAATTTAARTQCETSRTVHKRLACLLPVVRLDPTALKYS
jgi:hypothetical protein